MEFDNIQLPPVVMAALYGHCLVLVEGETMNEGQYSLEKILVGDELMVDENNGHLPAINVATNEIEVAKKDVISSAAFQIDKVTIIEKTDIQERSAAPYNDTPNRNPKKPTVPGDVDSPAAKVPAHLVKFLGGFNKRISIVVAEHLALHIGNDDLLFLEKLLQACNLSVNDVAIINVVANAAMASNLWELMPAEKMVMFDVDPGSIGLPFRSPHFQVQPWAGALFLTAPSLHNFQEGTPEQVVHLKRRLWRSLKKMFL